MAVGTLLLGILGVAVLVLCAAAVVGYLRDANRTKASQLKTELVATKANLRVAENALRSIANGSGVPILEAGSALDQIESNNSKELY